MGRVSIVLFCLERRVVHRVVVNLESSVKHRATVPRVARVAETVCRHLAWPLPIRSGRKVLRIFVSDEVN
jgi:hypothetical protein